MKAMIAWFAENHVAANLLMALIVVGGLATLPKLNQKFAPDVELDLIQVSVVYRGAAPEEVEEGVCIRIEEEVHSLQGIDRLLSSASEGACSVTAELISGYPIDRALTEFKNAVDGITTFPEETEKPIVTHLSPRRNAIQLAIAGEVPEYTLKVLGERVRDEIAALSGVTQVDVTPVRDYEISVEVPEASLRRHGLSFDDVVAAVRRSSLDRPGGSLKTDGGEILLRTTGQAYTGEEFARIVVVTREDGTRLRLGDVSKVVDGFEDEPRYARLDGEPALLVQVYREGDQRMLDLVASVKEYVGEAVTRIPEGISLKIWRDQSKQLRERLGILLRNAISGFVLVFCVLALFLRMRLAFWVTLGLLVSVLGSLWLFPTLGLSVNNVTLFGFVVVLGLLVDDAIVVGENVHRHQMRAEEPLRAAIQGAQEVTVPVVFGVLTTMVAFLPMMVAPGVMGQFFGALGIVVTCCLIFSLIESQLVLPAHLAHMRVDLHQDSEETRWQRLQRTLAGSLERFAEQRYNPTLEHLLEWRYATLAAAISTFLVAGALVASGLLPFTFFPEIEDDYVIARLSLAQGTPVERTAAVVEELEAAALRLKADLNAESSGAPLVEHVLATIGAHPSVAAQPRPEDPDQGAPTGSHLGEVTMRLQGGDTRGVSASAIARRWRELLRPIPDVEQLAFVTAFFRAGAPVDIQLRGTDIEGLLAAADRVKARLAEYPGVFDIADSFREGKEELELDIRPAAQTLGLTLDDLAGQVRQAFYGAEAQRIQRGRDDVRVMVRYPESQRRSLSDLGELRIRTPDGGEVPFYSVATAKPGRGYAVIERADRQRVINVLADVNAEKANANEIISDLMKDFLPMLVADTPELAFSLEGEQREQMDTLGAALRNYGIALLVIYALLAVPLRSYAQPLVIMGAIPFGLVGAIVGHLLLGSDLGIASIFGLIAVSGVVVNSSLVLVHYANERRGAGRSIEDAIRDAGQARFRPIVLTSLTTFVGLTPMLAETSITAQTMRPLAISLAFGVLFATTVSLLVVPCAYLALEDLTQVLGRGWRTGVRELLKPISPTRER